MYLRLAGEPGDKTSGGVDPAAAVDADLNEGDILAAIVVERRAAPVALGVGGFFDHRQDQAVLIDRGDSRLAELLDRGLVVAHDAGRALRAGVVDKAHEAEIQQVVAGDDQEVVVQAQAVDGELDVADGAEAGFVGGGAVVEDGDTFTFCPFLKDPRELMIGNHHVFIHHAGLVDVVDQPVQDGLVPHLQEGFREVFRQGVQPRGIAGGEDQTFHTLSPSALSHM